MDIGQGTKMDSIKNEITAIDVCYNTDKVVYNLPGVFWWSSTFQKAISPHLRVKAWTTNKKQCDTI